MLEKIKITIKNNKLLFFVFKKTSYFLSKTFRPKGIFYLFNSKKPLSSLYGLDRGVPIDRYYIEKFLKNNEELIEGNCLELLDNKYTKEFGGDNVKKSDILDIDTDNKRANIIGDLRNLSNIQSNSYNCIILTQVFQFIDDLDSAISECRRILKRGGCLLVTLPSVSRIDCVSGSDGDYWRFTKASAKYIFSKFFKKDDIEIKSFGNVSVCINFLAGVSLSEVNKNSLDFNDESFPLLITVKATKNDEE